MTYAKSNTRAQWFHDNYPGSKIDPNVVVLHTTESRGWPGYNGGATAPNITGLPDMGRKRLWWRSHFPDDRSARALRNTAGGVETNTLNCHQVELVGTCDPANRHRWAGYVAGEDYIYWPEAPEWALDELAAYLADFHRRHGVKLTAPRFLPYPASYGASSVRMSHAQWRSFYGVCGHQHVPENTHGDPGDLDVERVLAKARALVDPPAKRTPNRKRTPGKGWTRGKRVDAAITELRGATKAARERDLTKRGNRLARARRLLLSKITPKKEK